MNTINERNELSFVTTDLGIINKERGGTNRGQGRKRKEIDFEAAKKLAEVFCTKDEISSFLGVDGKTLSARIHEKFGLSFTEWFEQVSATGRSSLRSTMFRKALDGNVPLLIWLSKQYLGMSDKTVSSSENSTVIKLAYSSGDLVSAGGGGNHSPKNFTLASSNKDV